MHSKYLKIILLNMFIVSFVTKSIAIDTAQYVIKVNQDGTYYLWIRAKSELLKIV